MRQVKSFRDPAPSLLKYRLQRLWLTPSFRTVVKLGPMVLLALGIGTYLVRSPAVHKAVSDQASALKDAFESRQEFKVSGMVVSGASEPLKATVLGLVGLSFPMSSLDINVVQLREKIEALPRVSSAAVRVGSGGKLNIDLTERVPAVVWRSADGIVLLDKDGIELARIKSRLDRPDLPLVLGEGGGAAIAEAIELLDVASPLSDRIRGLQRVGQRRWTVVLDRDQSILLPEDMPSGALSRIVDLASREKLLEKDVRVIDIRDVGKPIVRLGASAAREMRGIGAIEEEADQ